RAALAKLGQPLVDEAMHADALEPDRVQHARRRFDDPRRSVPLALREEQALDRDAAERGQIHDLGVLDAVPEASAGRDERVREPQRSDLQREIHSYSEGLRPSDSPTRSLAALVRVMSMPRNRVPDDALRIEHGSFDARAGVVRLAAVGAAREDDAAVAAAEAAAHDLLQRDVAGAAVRAREVRAGAHHGCRAADIELDRIAEGPPFERVAERHGDPAAHAAAAVLGAEDDRDAQRLEQLDAVELLRAARAVEERRPR